MKLMKRNLSPIHYCLYKGKEPLLDDSGYETGETRISYESPVSLLCSVSPATGYAQVNMFGNLEWRLWVSPGQTQKRMALYRQSGFQW